MTLPNFVIAGAQKAGTSTLAATLRTHPHVFMARPKELHFFDRGWTRGVDWYREQFPAKKRHLAVGEATPSYLFEATVRERMHEVLPEARIIVSLREPVSRAYSHYWHQRRKGNERTGSFEEALELESDRINEEDIQLRVRHAYAARGLYLEQLEALAELYGREQIHVLLFEDLLGDRVPTLRRVLAFLGVDEDLAETMPERWNNRNSFQPGAAGEDADEDSDGDPDGSDDTGADTSGAPARRNATGSAYPPIDPETAARLHDFYREPNRRLGEWLSRDLSHWDR